MKPIILAGISLVVLSVLAMEYQGFTYSHRETLVDVTPIHATGEMHDYVSIPPLLGGLGLVGGVLLLVVGARKSS